MAAQVELAHAAAIAVNDKLVSIARLEAHPSQEARSAAYDIRDELLAAGFAQQAIGNVPSKAAEFAAAAQELKDMDLAASAKLVELVSGAPETAYPEAVKLDTWLTEGLVLVGPATDSLYVFENWGPGGAVLRHVDTGVLEAVAQADVINWKYLPGVGSEEILPVEVRLGDVIKFHPEGSYRKVRSIVRHGDTGLFSFSIEGSTIEFVRHVLEPVRRKDLTTPRR
jgi:hypothetical protein